MNNPILKYILLLAVILIFMIPVITLSVLDVEQKKVNEDSYRRMLAAEEARREAALKIEKKAYLMGKFDQTKREDFALIPGDYAVVPNIMYLRKEVLEAFFKMHEAAKKDGIDIKIASATRNFEYQKSIWDNKWNGVTWVEGKDLSKSIPDGLERFEKILEYSAAPGTSRHHWGTDIDINDANPAYFETQKGKKVHDWLINNAAGFGFCQTYDLKGAGRTSGYHEEKWHWSYMPLAGAFLEEYKDLVKNEDIGGFKGDEYAPQLDIINNYVLAINSACI